MEEASGSTETTQSKPAIEPAQLLAKGLLDLYVPRLKHAKVCLTELTDKQASVLATLEKQTQQYSEHALRPTVELMNTICTYKSKVISLRKRMLSVHQRTQALKKRALFIRDFKTKELEETLRKRRQEEALIGGGSGQSSSSSGTIDTNAIEANPSVFTI